MDADTGDTGTGVATVAIIYTVDIYIDDEHWELHLAFYFLSSPTQYSDDSVDIYTVDTSNI